MSEGFKGGCLCGAVSFECAAAPKFQANCHCDDCRKSGGGVYASYAFVDESTITIQGETGSYASPADSGNTMTRHFCTTCGSPVFHTNSRAPSRLGIRVGLIDSADWFQPQANVYTCRRLPSTPLDPEITAFDKMRS
ncbi:MAG: GFA family protein [Arenicellales bacterium]